MEKGFAEISQTLKNDGAMTIKNPRLGDVVFSAGTLGNLAKKNTGGFGMKHVIQGRFEKDGLNEHEIAAILRLMKDVVETVSPADIDRPKINLVKNGIWACVQQNWLDTDEKWIITGFGETNKSHQMTKEATDAIKAVIAEYGYAPEFLSVGKQVGAVIASINSIRENQKIVNKKSQGKENFMENEKNAGASVGNAQAEQKKMPLSDAIRRMWAESGLDAESARDDEKILTDEELRAAIGKNLSRLDEACGKAGLHLALAIGGEDGGDKKITNISLSKNANGNLAEFVGAANAEGFLQKLGEAAQEKAERLEKPRGLRGLFNRRQRQAAKNDWQEIAFRCEELAGLQKVLERNRDERARGKAAAEPQKAESEKSQADSKEEYEVSNLFSEGIKWKWSEAGLDVENAPDDIRAAIDKNLSRIDSLLWTDKANVKPTFWRDDEKKIMFYAEYRGGDIIFSAENSGDIFTGLQKEAQEKAERLEKPRGLRGLFNRRQRQAAENDWQEIAFRCEELSGLQKVLERNRDERARGKAAAEPQKAAPEKDWKSMPPEVLKAEIKKLDEANLAAFASSAAKSDLLKFGEKKREITDALTGRPQNERNQILIRGFLAKNGLDDCEVLTEGEAEKAGTKIKRGSPFIELSAWKKDEKGEWIVAPPRKYFAKSACEEPEKVDSWRESQGGRKPFSFDGETLTCTSSDPKIYFKTYLAACKLGCKFAVEPETLGAEWAGRVDDLQKSGRLSQVLDAAAQESKYLAKSFLEKKRESVEAAKRREANPSREKKRESAVER